MVLEPPIWDELCIVFIEVYSLLCLVDIERLVSGQKGSEHLFAGDFVVTLPDFDVLLVWVLWSIISVSSHGDMLVCRIAVFFVRYLSC